MQVLILRNQVNSLDGNNIMFADEFKKRGWTIYFGVLTDFLKVNGRLQVLAKEYKKHIAWDTPLAGDFKRLQVDSMNLIWVMNQPISSISRDIYQLLWATEQEIKFVNTIESINFLNNKNNVDLVIPKNNQIPSKITSSTKIAYEELSDGQKHVIKPTNDGGGNNVFVVSSDNINSKAIVQSLTGNKEISNDIYGSANESTERYCIIQSDIKKDNSEEKRVIVAGGKIIGAHGRVSSNNDFRTNLMQGGKLLSTTLSKDEYLLCDAIAKNLHQYGVDFCGLDLCYPYVLELNIVNPGGIPRICQIDNNDLSSATVQAILDAKGLI